MQSQRDLFASIIPNSDQQGVATYEATCGTLIELDPDPAFDHSTIGVTDLRYLHLDCTMHYKHVSLLTSHLFAVNHS